MIRASSRAPKRTGRGGTADSAPRVDRVHHVVERAGERVDVLAVERRDERAVQPLDDLVREEVALVLDFLDLDVEAEAEAAVVAAGERCARGGSARILMSRRGVGCRCRVRSPKGQHRETRPVPLVDVAPSCARSRSQPETAVGELLHLVALRPSQVVDTLA
jgi:hypothetical protein